VACWGLRAGGQVGFLRCIVGTDCSRVLNVNRSLYGSTSRVERSQRVVLRAQRARPVRGPDLYYGRDSCLRLICCVVCCFRIKFKHDSDFEIADL